MERSVLRSASTRAPSTGARWSAMNGTSRLKKVLSNGISLLHVRTPGGSLFRATLRQNGGTAVGHEFAVPDDGLAVARHRTDGPHGAAAHVEHHVVDFSVEVAPVRIVVAHAGTHQRRTQHFGAVDGAVERRQAGTPQRAAAHRAAAAGIPGDEPVAGAGARSARGGR